MSLDELQELSVGDLIHLNFKGVAWNSGVYLIVGYDTCFQRIRLDREVIKDTGNTVSLYALVYYAEITRLTNSP